MGANAYLAYTVVWWQGISWQMVLFTVFVEGIVFIIMSLTNERKAIFNFIVIVFSFLFLPATLFSPLFTSVPSFAIAQALIFVGFMRRNKED